MSRLPVSEQGVERIEHVFKLEILPVETDTPQEFFQYRQQHIREALVRFVRDVVDAETATVEEERLMGWEIAEALFASFKHSLVMDVLATWLRERDKTS